jgi:hypothetical protein
MPVQSSRECQVDKTKCQDFVVLGRPVEEFPSRRLQPLRAVLRPPWSGRVTLFPCFVDVSAAAYRKPAAFPPTQLPVFPPLSAQELISGRPFALVHEHSATRHCVAPFSVARPR